VSNSNLTSFPSSVVRLRISPAWYGHLNTCKLFRWAATAQLTYLVDVAPDIITGWQSGQAEQKSRLQRGTDDRDRVVREDHRAYGAELYPYVRQLLNHSDTESKARALFK